MPTYRAGDTPPPPISEPGPDGTETLPALRGLKDLADLRPVLVVDSREQAPLVFKRFASVRGTLNAGDYSIRGLESSFAVERKSVDDFANCCMGTNRERFERELHRLRGYRFKRLLVIGSRDEIAAGRYHSQITPRAVFATLEAFEIRYDLPVVFAPNPEAGAAMVEVWVWRYAREVVENVNNLLRGCRLEPATP